MLKIKKEKKLGKIHCGVDSDGTKLYIRDTIVIATANKNLLTNDAAGTITRVRLHKAKVTGITDAGSLRYRFIHGGIIMNSTTSQRHRVLKIN